MTNKEKLAELLKLPATRTMEGKYGIVKITSDIEITSGISPGLKQIIQRYTSDYDLITEITYTLTLDNSWETFFVKEKVTIDGGRELWLTLSFRNWNYFNFEHYFRGCFDIYTIYSGKITADTYAKSRKRVMETCNPHLPYKINHIIDLLRGSNNSELNEWIMTLDKTILKKQNHIIKNVSKIKTLTNKLFSK